MKKTFLFPAVLILAIFAVLFAGCSKMKDKMLDDMILSYDLSKYMSHQININVMNANSESSIMPNAKLSITGKNANEVYDINGGRNIVMGMGYAEMVLAPGKEISTPMEFNVTATADGFIPITKTITIHPKDSFTVHSLMMLEINNPPQGVDIKSIKTDAQQLSNSTLSISSSTFDGETRQNVNLNLPTGMALYDDNRNIISDPVTVNIVNYNSANSSVRSLLPHIIHCTTNKLIRDGMEDDATSFIPLNVFNLNISNASKSITSTSKPIKTIVEFSPNTYNPMTSENLKVGDIMSVYFRKNADAKWIFSQDVTVAQNTSGTLYVEIQVSQSGDFVTLARGGRKNICSDYLTINFTRPNMVNTLHDVEIREANSNKLIFEFPEVAVCNGCSFTLPSKLPIGKKISIYVYEFDFPSFKSRLVNSVTDLNACPTSVTIDVDPLTINGNPLLQFDLKTYCPNEPTSVEYKHTGRIYYRFYDEGRWINLGLALNGYMETDRLRFDTKYNFRTSVTIMPKYSNRLKTQQFTRSRWTWRDPTLFGQTPDWGFFNLVPLTTNTYKFSRDSWIAPLDACQVYGYGN